MSETSMTLFDDIPDSKYDMESFRSVTKAGDYLPRLQLMTAKSDVCVEGKFPSNHYAMIQDQNFTDLGLEVDMIPISWRPKAMEIGDQVIAIHDTKDPEFARIQEKAGEPDSGCMYGPEFLCWIPKVKAFATLLLGSKSARREAPGIQGKMHESITLQSKLVSKGKFKWQAICISTCSTPLDLPDKLKMMDEMKKFDNPPKQDIERADDSNDRDR